MESVHFYIIYKIVISIVLHYKSYKIIYKIVISIVLHYITLQNITNIKKMTDFPMEYDNLQNNTFAPLF